MSGTAVKRCAYQFETARGQCCLADEHKDPVTGKPSPHQLWRGDWVDDPMPAASDAVAASLLRKESGPTAPDGAFLSREQLIEIVKRRRENRDSLWKAALEKHRYLNAKYSGLDPRDSHDRCICGLVDISWAQWIEHVAANLEDLR